MYSLSVRSEASVTKSVLLVDDDSLSAMTVEAMLECVGVAADLAENGRVAVAKATEGDYACILMDIEMPVMDGLEATKVIRAREAESGLTAVKIIAVTGHTSTGIKVLCEKAGMTSMLLKPFGVDALRDKLAEVCGDDLDLDEI